MGESQGQQGGRRCLRETDNDLDAMIGGLHQTLQPMTKLYRKDARQRDAVSATELEKTEALLEALHED